MTDNHSENTKRIAKNTFFLTGRMLFGMLVSLYTSRIILQALGVENFGIYSVVGGLVAMFSIVSGSIQASISRYITFELGRRDPERIQKTFSTAFMIQAILAGLIFILGETIGVWFLNTYLVIPEERLFAANIVFQASILTFMLGLILMPYYACINAHEHMNVYAYFGVLDILLRLIIVLFIAYSPWHFDKLIVYSLMLVVLGIFMQTLAVTYCRRHFSESKVRYKLDKELMRSMSKFAGWNFIGASAGLLRDQGGNILLNIFFGTVVNAARSIAGSVTAAVGGFTGNFLSAVNPQITKSYASGDREYMMELIYRSAKFGFMITMLFALPILFNTDFILKVWLKTPPPDSAIFVRLVLIQSMIETLSIPLMTVMLATGNIKRYQIIVGGVNLCNFPISLLFLWMGYPPYSIFVISIILTLIATYARVVMLKDMIGFNDTKFLFKVCGNCAFTFALSCLAPYIVSRLILSNLHGLLMSLVVCFFFSIPIILYVGCSKKERYFLFNQLNKVKSKFRLA